MFLLEAWAVLHNRDERNYGLYFFFSLGSATACYSTIYWQKRDIYQEFTGLIDVHIAAV